MRRQRGERKRKAAMQVCGPGGFRALAQTAAANTWGGMAVLTALGTLGMMSWLRFRIHLTTNPTPACPTLQTLVDPEAAAKRKMRKQQRKASGKRKQMEHVKRLRSAGVAGGPGWPGRRRAAGGPAGAGARVACLLPAHRWM